MQHYYPDERITATSKYSHQEICQTLELWYKIDDLFKKTMTFIEYDALSQEMKKSLEDLEAIEIPCDGIWHRAGNPERFPVRKWQSCIKQHVRILKQLVGILEKQKGETSCIK